MRRETPWGRGQHKWRRATRSGSSPGRLKCSKLQTCASPPILWCFHSCPSWWWVSDKWALHLLWRRLFLHVCIFTHKTASKNIIKLIQTLNIKWLVGICECPVDWCAENRLWIPVLFRTFVKQYNTTEWQCAVRASSFRLQFLTYGPKSQHKNKNMTSFRLPPYLWYVCQWLVSCICKSIVCLCGDQELINSVAKHSGDWNAIHFGTWVAIRSHIHTLCPLAM